MQLVVGGKETDLVDDAESHSNVKSCQSVDGIQQDDPCLKLPCGSHGQCLSTGSSRFTCLCDKDYLGAYITS